MADTRDILRMSAAADVFHGASALQFLLYALQNGDGMAWITAVVAPLHDAVVGVGTCHGHLDAVLLQRQDAVVLKQHHALLSHLVGKVAVVLRAQHLFGYLHPRHD